MNWGLLGPLLWCFQKHQKIKLVINIISVAWRCLILQHTQKMQHRIPQWALPCFYSFFFNFVFKSVLHFSFQATWLSPTLPHSLINLPEELSSANLFLLPEGNFINSFFPYHAMMYSSSSASAYWHIQKHGTSFNYFAEIIEKGGRLLFCFKSFLSFFNKGAIFRKDLKGKWGEESRILNPPEEEATNLHPSYIIFGKCASKQHFNGNH